MNRKETVMAVGVLVFALALIVGVFLFSPSPKTENKSATSSAEHDGMNVTNQPDQDIGAIVDLTNQSEVSMNIQDFKYEKPNIKIKKGTKVTWTNQDDIKHNVMLEHEGSDKPHDPPTANEVDPNELAGPLLAKGESYSFTFNEVTANPYHCSPHPYMKGSVTVVE